LPRILPDGNARTATNVTPQRWGSSEGL